MEFKFNLGDTEGEYRTVPLDAGHNYDLLILGGGPAAMTAAVYAMRKGMSAGLITESMGGQVSETSVVENYLGYRYIEGVNLVERFKEQVKQFEIGFLEGAKAGRIEDGPEKRVHLEDGSAYRAKTLILCTGKSWRKLNVPGEREFTGRGVAYCSICDAPLFAGKDVVVVGGGNSGLESAIDLAKIARSVTIVQFLDSLTADDILVRRLEEFSNIRILYESEVTEIRGDVSVNSVIARNRKTGGAETIEAQGIFIEIGLVPNSDPVKGVLDLNGSGEIIVDCSCATSRPGIFAAGDVTSVPYKQIIIAAGEGAKAALSAYDYVLRNGKAPS